MLVYLQLIETEEDKSKFEEIYSEYRYLMQFLANRRLHNKQDAEDAVHKVFVKIAEKIKTIEPVCPKTKRLIVLMIENTVTDMLRKRSNHPNEEYSDENLVIPEPEYEEKEVLDACIRKLPEKQRTVIWLKYYDGYSLREIAGFMGISLASAQKLDQRAKKRLVELYREDGDDL